MTHLVDDVGRRGVMGVPQLVAAHARVLPVVLVERVEGVDEVVPVAAATLEHRNDVVAPAAAPQAAAVAVVVVVVGTEPTAVLAVVAGRLVVVVLLLVVDLDAVRVRGVPVIIVIAAAAVIVSVVVVAATVVVAHRRHPRRLQQVVRAAVGEERVEKVPLRAAGPPALKRVRRFFLSAVQRVRRVGAEALRAILGARGKS